MSHPKYSKLTSCRRWHKLACLIHIVRGLSPSEIAAELGKGASTVRFVLTSPAGKLECARIAKKYEEAMANLSAAQLIERLERVVPFDGKSSGR